MATPMWRTMRSDLAAVAHGLDELDRAPRAVGRGLYANEHGESVARGGGVGNRIYTRHYKSELTAPQLLSHCFY